MTTETATPEFTLTRVFDAPRALVWKAHTELEHLKQWWGPKGFVWLRGTLDLRPGGLFHYGMRSPDGHEMWGKFVFREIAPQDRLAYVVSFSDENAGVTRHPMSQTWPLEVRSTVDFVEQDGKTTLNMKGTPVNATEEERKTFEGAKEGMAQGYKGTLDQLEEYLAGK